MTPKYKVVSVVYFTYLVSTNSLCFIAGITFQVSRVLAKFECATKTDISGTSYAIEECAQTLQNDACLNGINQLKPTAGFQKWILY